MSDPKTYDAVRADFIEKSGLISQAEGLPRIAGRFFGILIFDGDMISFGELATRLQVSRASISTSIRILEERGLVKRMTKAGERQDYFQLAANPYATMLEGIQKRMRSTREEIAATISALPAGTGAVRRLQDYATFYASTDEAVGMALNKLNTQNTPPSGPPATAGKEQTDD